VKTTPDALARLPAAVRAVLLEGDDQGGARFAATAFLSARAPRVRRFDAADLSARPEAVEAAATAGASLFGAPDAVLVSGVSGRQAQQALDLARRAQAPLAIVAGPLDAKSALVKGFAEADDLAHCPCPLLDSAGKGRLVDAAFGRRIDAEARARLQQLLPEDSGAARAALATLQAFLDGRPPTTVLVDRLLDDQSASDADAVVDAVLDGRADRLPAALRSLPPGESRDVGLLRLLHWHAQRLHAVRAATDAGESMDHAVGQLRPPAFGLAKAALARRAKAWTTRGLEALLARLTEAEAQQKRGVDGPTATAHALLLAAQQGPR
jgi:DNA polymerase-3 subunit delta